MNSFRREISSHRKPSPHTTLDAWGSEALEKPTAEPQGSPLPSDPPKSYNNHLGHKTDDQGIN